MVVVVGLVLPGGLRNHSPPLKQVVLWQCRRGAACPLVDAGGSAGSGASRGCPAGPSLFFDPGVERASEL